ncbi:recombinase family protein [Shewanella submarina]|uniref:Recombinase family protein n=1 Tax=Shewanella submarina TaxID=2016376 RepID=A0ABV7G5S3_9GAMM|nr:recombinase family protein [Shewanella submarina]MCL1038370.1 recombinase family protein [Shewanella submarina]
MKAILYQRFSDSTQSVGSSIYRQSKLATEWCDKHGAELIDVVTDAGVSAFKGKHAKRGALSEVITAIENGDIPKGSYLLIENIDRLGRDQIAEAQERFISILRRGVKIVTLQDGKVFDEESANNMGDIIWLVVSMARANEESKTKSNRAFAAWEAKKKDVDKGKKPKLRCPSWLDYNNETESYELNDKAKYIELIFDLYIEFRSMSAVARELNKLGVPRLGKAKDWGQTSVRWILINKAVIGELHSRSLRAENFFPQIVSDEKFFLVRSILDKKNDEENKISPKSNGEYSNVLTGIGRCGVCGDTMFMHGKSRYSEKAGAMVNYKYLKCTSRRHNYKGCGLPTFRYIYLEAVISVIAAKLESMPNSGESISRSGWLKGTIDSLLTQLKDTESKIDNLIDVLADTPSAKLKTKLKELEKKCSDIRVDIDKHKAELSRISNSKSDSSLFTKVKLSAESMKDPNYRVRFASAISRMVDKFIFNQDGSIYIEAMGNTIHVNRIKGDVEIKFNDSDESMIRLTVK